MIPTREELETNPTVSPLGKLLIEWLSRRERRVYTATELSAALATYNAEIIDSTNRLRQIGALDRMDGDTMLQPSQVKISKPAWLSYQSISKDKKK